MYQPNQRVLYLHVTNRSERPKWVFSIARIMPGTNPSTKPDSYNIVSQGNIIPDVERKYLLIWSEFFFKETNNSRFWIHPEGDIIELVSIQTETVKVGNKKRNIDIFLLSNYSEIYCPKVGKFKMRKEIFMQHYIPLI